MLRWIFWWNLANIITCSRVIITPVAIFVIPWDSYFEYPWNIGVRGIVYALLLLTDRLDGTFAKAAGNTKGIGVVLDSLADKIMHVYGLTFLWVYELLDPWMIILITGGEVIVLGIITMGIILVRRQERKKYELGFFSSLVNKKLWTDVYRKVKERLISDIKVDDSGRIKMGFYFFGYGFTAINIFLDPASVLNSIFNFFRLVSFSSGILFSYSTDVKYYKKFEKWKKTNFPDN